VVERQLAKWAKESGLAVKLPTTIAEAVLQSEIRAHLAAMKGSKLDFLAKHVEVDVISMTLATDMTKPPVRETQQPGSIALFRRFPGDPTSTDRMSNVGSRRAFALDC
jgi:hypothetical protein